MRSSATVRSMSSDQAAELSKRVQPLVWQVIGASHVDSRKIDARARFTLAVWNWSASATSQIRRTRAADHQPPGERDLRRDCEVRSSEVMRLPLLPEAAMLTMRVWPAPDEAFEVVMEERDRGDHDRRQWVAVFIDREHIRNCDR